MQRKRLLLYLNVGALIGGAFVIGFSFTADDTTYNVKVTTSKPAYRKVDHLYGEEGLITECVKTACGIYIPVTNENIKDVPGDNTCRRCLGTNYYQEIKDWQ